MTLAGLALVALALASGALGAMLVRRFARPLGLVAEVTSRSSHRAPTPTGGGIGMVVGGTLGLLPPAVADPSIAAIGLVALAIAALGLVDDRWQLSPALRLPLQLLGTAFILLLALPGLDWWLLPILVLAAGWWLNLYNFMDGIDGLAGAEAVFILAAAALLSVGAFETPLWWALAATAAASLGFLLFNWPPAKVFMGDVGATWLGAIIVAFVALSTGMDGFPTLWQWLILGGAFLADASVTLAVRAFRGERLWQAHRSHAYQRLARQWGGHRPVTLAYLSVNVAWLLPLAALAGVYPAWGMALSFLAVLPLGVATVWLGAGQPDAVSRAPT